MTPRERLADTYSIVARDPASGQMGVAVQSHAFCVGAAVPWAQAGVGAVATQSLTEVSYGPLGLELMRAGRNAEQALRGLLAADPRLEVRQVAMVNAQGNVAAHTGTGCIREAGHHVGGQFSTQANLMLRDTVWHVMAEAFEAAQGDLAGRMMVALEAAEAEGGDIRGRQSAALLVVAGLPTGKPWRDRLFDLRVDDHPEPLVELRRLLAAARAEQESEAAYDLLHEAPLDDDKLERARQAFERALAAAPDLAQNPEVVFWHAVALAEVGQMEEARPLFARVFAAGARWRDLVPRLPPSGLLPDDPGLIERILAAGP